MRMKMVCDDRTLREVANEFLALKKAQKVRERTLSDYKKYIDKFLEQSDNSLDVDVLKVEILEYFADMILPYLFNTTGMYPHNKEKLFAQWGYTADDARWLQSEIERQALEKYLSGDYELGKLDWNGQRISIRVEIPRRDQAGIVSFATGWMVEANGKLRLNTPYGGK